jgi:hypothetical protein
MFSRSARLNSRAPWIMLANLRTRWTLTRTEARASLAPPAVLQRADAVLSDIDAMRALLQAQRGAILVLQDQVGQEMRDARTRLLASSASRRSR